MSPKRLFICTTDHALLSPPVLAPFDSTFPLILQREASHLYGKNYALFQDHGQGWLCLVQCGTTETETCYTII